MVEQVEEGDGRPREQRDSLFLSCEIEMTGARQLVAVRVRNLSPGGMMIDGNPIFYEGAHVKTTLRGIGDVTGRIAWIAPERAGVAFDITVDPKLARTQIGGKTSAEKTGWSQSGIR